jgi:hypothetical protein
MLFPLFFPFYIQVLFTTDTDMDWGICFCNGSAQASCSFLSWLRESQTYPYIVSLVACFVSFPGIRCRLV